jgi:hypothetical protein
MRTLAYVVYSRIRLFAPSPFGMIDVAKFETAVLFFGFRYQPPYLLRRSAKEMTMHIGWDPENDLTAWMDDIGSVLHVLADTTLEVLIRLVIDLVEFLKDVKLTLTILGEGISEELFVEIQNKLGKNLKRTAVFAVCPAPAVQVVFRDVFDDDALIFAQREQCWQGEFREPIISGYVVSQHHPAYLCLLYVCYDSERPQVVLRGYVQNMSYLSWLSVKPGSEKRTIAYPPHIGALLRKNHEDTLVVSRFEFLPSKESI